ncbi:MAG: 30S ribosomal protein S8 [Anaerolineae bacterium]|jgi:small subunit ribosomal protein S8|uniref:30S ribosomal protein S8 n=1 Tax=Candidatus Amarolinea dominans TaxID=3140696 RepID=UPI001DDECBDF|nr:30S ribosomal protein S8 [Anaerolineae bacterium]MBK7201425.1 30S ribosomal protein S8 [Anaerolineae bacterium]MBK9095115.1 30S ribosomal protein S8 [Anaerolineae bacterium]MBK9232550.1 30S ribosomal protein S8 [Anaerolineae bacterium]
MVNDPIADMLTRIRNALMARHRQVLIPSSKMKVAVARLLKEEGFIQHYDVTRDRPQPMLRIILKYDKNRKPVLSGLKRVSKPGCRVYTPYREIPWVLSGMGVAILTTPRGMMTDRQARRAHLGGEVLCYVW